MTPEILNHQKLLFNLIFDNNLKLPTTHTLLESIVGLSDGIIEIILGEVGFTLRKFAASVDLEHPDLFEILGPYTPILDSAIQLSNYLEEHSYPPLQREFPRLLPSSIRDELEVLENPQQLIRLLKSKEDRELLRRNKKPSSVQFGNTTKKGDTVFNNQPRNFDLFTRHSAAYLEECKKVEKKADRYKQLGCESLYQEMLKGIEEYQNQFCDSHYGFHKITMTSAALILAKLHEYVCSELTVDNWEINKKTLEGIQIYCPIIMPVHDAQYQPESVMAVIDHLESFPDAAGKPIFDHYLILTPSFARVNIDKRGNTSVKATPNYWDLIKNNECVPILLGECNGKCYFICYYSENTL